MNPLELLESHTSFKGEQRIYRHYADTLRRPLELAVYVPVAMLLKERPCHTNYYLPGLQTSARLVASQSDYQRYANRYDTILVIPDLFNVYQGDDDARTGQYAREREALDDYLINELPALLRAHLNTSGGRGIMGYGFGGTLAIHLAHQNPDHYRSISALAPWLGFYGTPWYDEHLARYNLPAEFDPLQWYLAHPDAAPLPLWIDQGTDDDHLGNKINLEAFEEGVKARIKSGEILINRRKRYDHSFYFVHSHIPEHFAFHNEYQD
ncbi:alpha/beta hydrolase-fold protein [uncultured Cardiobacterium sp.]|uniref:alpha/beta hydrolase n=1 Tax=uncultured Cardiobacterium sp. TaxID=417619 RepID=UPI002631918F|nr:alpha/beta hydrolase-fold protein [uncultured Cardiobacterium sp.]